MTIARRRTHAIIAIILLAMGGAFALCASCTTSSATPETTDVGTRSGEVRTSSFIVEEDDRIVVKEDLHIIAEREVVVRGEILGERGATIEITAPSITIHGMIQAGNGEDRNGVLEHGQDGGSVILNSPQIVLAGAIVVGGHGGNAGPAGNGGHGGDVLLNDAVNIASDRARLVGGNGGNPGDGINGHGEAARNGGHGGSGGSVR